MLWKNNNGAAFGGAQGALRAPGIVVFVHFFFKKGR
jgi:hypothetical protein